MSKRRVVVTGLGIVSPVGLNLDECWNNIVAGKIRIKGLPMGVIASNGVGIIFVEAARKATEWIVRCSQEKIPLLFIQNAPGYMVGSESEHMGMGKYGADMVRAVSCAQVPRIQLVIGPDNGAANYGIALELDAETFEKIDFLGDDLLGQPEFGDAVYQHAACFVKGLVDGNVMAFDDEIAGHRQARGTGTDNSNFFTGWCLLGRQFTGTVGPFPVSGIAFQIADGHRLAFFTEDVVQRHANIVEVKLRGIGRPPHHFAMHGDGFEARRSMFH